MGWKPKLDNQGAPEEYHKELSNKLACMSDLEVGSVTKLIVDAATDTGEERIQAQVHMVDNEIKRLIGERKLTKTLDERKDISKKL